MANPSSPSRLSVKRLGWLALSLAIFGIAAVLVANVVDYRRYYRAAHFEQTEGLDMVRALARTCFDLGKAGHVNSTTYPTNITRLKPRWVSIDHDYAQIGLYGHDDDGAVFLVFENHGGNAVVTVCDYVRGVSEGRVIFVQDQTAYEFLHPKGRVLTLAQGTMHEYVEWIVLPDEVRVITHPGSGGPQVLGRRPISIDERQAIEAAMKSFPPALRGRHFQAGVEDGCQLYILFGADGRRGSADIELDNTWRDEAGPLLDLIERVSPKERELRFHAIMERELKEFPREQSAITWAEQEKLERPPMPWWCLWPRL